MTNPEKQHVVRACLRTLSFKCGRRFARNFMSSPAILVFWECPIIRLISTRE
jgi:hypothetical protein